jgi:hypothetical protein
MRRCKREWLLCMCLISIHLIGPLVFEGLLVGAQGSSPPALTPLLVKQVDEMASIFRFMLQSFSRFIYMF